MSPENLLKWEAVHPEPDRYDFEPADRYVEFGAKPRDVRGRPRAAVAPADAGLGLRRRGREEGRPRRRCSPACESHIDDGRRPLPRPHRRLGRRQRGARRGRDAAQDALARGDRRGLHREGLRVRARGRPRRRALLQRLQPLEAGQARRRHSARPGAEGEGPARRRHRRAGRTGASTTRRSPRSTPPSAAMRAAGHRRRSITELDMDVLPRDPDMWGADLSKKAKIRAATNVYPDGLPPPCRRSSRAATRTCSRSS